MEHDAMALPADLVAVLGALGASADALAKAVTRLSARVDELAEQIGDADFAPRSYNFTHN